MKKVLPFSLLLILTMLWFSCSKEPGEGGNSTIYGKLTAYNYNAEFTYLRGIYPAADEDVYLIYGDDKSYSQRIRSNFDGVFEFKYLRPGNYTVYAYSKDSTLKLVSGIYPVIRNIKIEKNKQDVDAGDIKIFK